MRPSGRGSVTTSGPAAPEGTRPEEGLGPGAPGPAARLLIVDRPGAAQTELRVGHLGAPRTSPDYHALVLLNAVLGGHFSSRLNLNLRERKGYTYGVRSAFEFRKMAGPFSVQTSVQTDATADAVAEILRELGDLAGRRPASDDEQTLSVATLTKGYPRNFETAGQVARGLAQLALYESAGRHVRRVRPADSVTEGRGHHAGRGSVPSPRAGHRRGRR